MLARVCCRCHKVVSGECSCKPLKQTSHSKGYGRKWRDFRERVYRMRVKEGKALCAMCCKPFGKESPHADHIIPVLSNDDPLFYEASNIQFLHPSCHAAKTEKDVKAGRTR